MKYPGLFLRLFLSHFAQQLAIAFIAFVALAVIAVLFGLTVNHNSFLALLVCMAVLITGVSLFKTWRSPTYQRMIR